MLQGLAQGSVTPSNSVGSYNTGSELTHGRMSPPLPGGSTGSFEAFVAALPATAHIHNLSLTPSPATDPLYSASSLNRPQANKRPRRDWENSTNCPQDFALDLPPLVTITVPILADELLNNAWLRLFLARQEHAMQSLVVHHCSIKHPVAMCT